MQQRNSSMTLHLKKKMDRFIIGIGFILLWCMFDTGYCMHVREKPSKRIDAATWDTTITKLENTLTSYENADIPIKQRSLVVFHIGDMARPTDSLDIMMNNVNIFINAVELHSQSATYKAFYLFNVVDNYNPIINKIPLTKPNVGMLKWTTASSDLDAHLRTMRILGRNITDRFNDIICANQGVRGPLLKRKNGEWIGEFKNLLNANNVGMVGPTMSCEVSPHIQTHMFALRTALIPTIMTQMRQNITSHFKSWTEVIAALEVGMTGVVLRAGYNVSSFLYNNRGHPYFQSGKCLVYTGPPNRFDKNPVGWCGVTPAEQVFIKWGGEPMRTRGMICNDTVLQMEDMLLSLTATEPALQLTLPEALMGGVLFPLFKEYVAETWIDRHPLAPPLRAAAPQVCFLVRVINIPADRMRHSNSYSRLINKDIELLITSLRRQSNPNWKAIFYRIDTLPSEGDLAALLASFKDSRLEHRAQTSVPPYHSDDAGYRITDTVLRQMLAREDCQFVSITTSDNAYGSDVVQRVLSAAVDTTTSSTTAAAVGTSTGVRPSPTAAPDLVLVPMDSRRFLEQDMLYNKKFQAGGHLVQEDYCSLLANLEQSGLTYGFRPTPVVGKLDIASAFFSRQKLAEENILFDHFADRMKFPCAHNLTDPVSYKCLGNQGSYMVHHLVQRRLWKHVRQPIDGLRSVVFQGNSPTLCIGAGDVWIDTVWNGKFVDTSMQMCITPKDALSINPEIVFDMEHFFKQDHIVGTCFRARNPAPVVTHLFKPY